MQVYVFLAHYFPQEISERIYEYVSVLCLFCYTEYLNFLTHNSPGLSWHIEVLIFTFEHLFKVASLSVYLSCQSKHLLHKLCVSFILKVN